MSSAFTGSPTTYSVTATFTQAGAWGSSSSTVPILVITGKTATTFVINSDNDSGTAITAPSGGVTVNWIAMPAN